MSVDEDDLIESVQTFMHEDEALITHNSTDLTMNPTFAKSDEKIIGRESLNDQTIFEAFKSDPMNHVWIFWLYFFEYCVITSFLDRIAQLRDAESSDFWFEKNMFTISQFLYQAGVLIARSSLYCLKLKITGTIAAVLFAHFVLFFILCL